MANASTSVPSNTISDTAPERPLPSTPFYSIEYPGYVRPTSVPQAIRTLGGQSTVDSAFKRSAAKLDRCLELNFRPDNPFSHPVPGEIVPTTNIVIKVVQRRRKISKSHDCGPIGEYTLEAVGVIPKTARFRGMVDYQYNPDPDDRVTKLRMAMERFDVDEIRQFSIPEENEDYVISEDPLAMVIDPQLSAESAAEPPRLKSNLRLFPPPLFSRQNVPQHYNFKANPASVVATITNEETGVETKRLINRMRWKGYGPTSILFTDSGIPGGPSPAVVGMRNQVDTNIHNALVKKFEERPVWTRTAILNQFTAVEAREINNSKVHLPLVAYVFQDGPWRDTFVRFGYDPRTDVNARFYQRLYFRNANHPIVRASVTERRQDVRHGEGDGSGIDKKHSHIFDGVHLTTETAAFQLCDIHDSMLKDMIESEEEFRDACNVSDGWFSSHAIERIKVVLRHKFFSLLDGHVATDDECEALLVTEPGTKPTAPRVPNLRLGKHNMAKGAIPPEDLAAARLQAALQKNAKRR